MLCSVSVLKNGDPTPSQELKSEELENDVSGPGIQPNFVSNLGKLTTQYQQILVLPELGPRKPYYLKVSIYKATSLLPTNLRKTHTT